MGDGAEHSWSTGDDSGDSIYSHYERLLDLNPDISGNSSNCASTGAPMSFLDTQVFCAHLDGAEYMTILMGSNDACTGSLGSMTSLAVFEDEFRDAMDELAQRLPNAKVYVLSLPDIYQLYDVGRDKGCDWMWSAYGICQSLLSGSNTEADRLAFRDRVIGYNEILERVANEYGHRYSSVIFDYQFMVVDVSNIDCFHPSLIGQEKIAQASWEDGYFEVDEDGDGYNIHSDCNDSDPDIYPGAPELCGDGKDNDCDGSVDECCNGLEGDVNGDLVVNIFDLAMVGLCYGQPAAGGCESVDVTGDGSVNIFDLATVGLNYGSVC